MFYEVYMLFFFFKQKTAYEMRISDWSSDVCSSDLLIRRFRIGIQEQIRPHRVVAQSYQGRPVEPEVVQGVMTFVLLFGAMTALATVLLTATGVDLVTAFSGAATAITNTGPALGDIAGPAGTFAPLPDAAKWILSLAMLLGRLELLTVLVMLNPGFWRR